MRALYPASISSDPALDGNRFNNKCPAMALAPRREIPDQIEPDVPFKGESRMVLHRSLLIAFAFLIVALSAFALMLSASPVVLGLTATGVD
jgi:hypothetical protein